MRVISKKISYDDLTSKLPGIIPSIMNTWSIPPLYENCGNISEGETYFSYSSAVKRASEYNINASQLEYRGRFVEFDKNNLIEFTVGNYGLIPSDVIIPNEIAKTITDYTDIYVNLPDGNGGFYDLSWPKVDSGPHYDGRKIISGGTEIKILTYYTLNKWYTFFKKYYELVHHPDYPKNYNSAIDFYNNEIFVKNEEQETYYQSLDDTFNARGGEKMYNWISNNCIVQFQIPKKYVDEWNTTYLYYPDAIKWYYWFSERNEKYKSTNTIEGCTTINFENGSCQDCVEYIKLGGEDFFNILKKWVDEVKVDPKFITNSASVTIPISFTNSIDDLGEMSIFSSKWKEEEDYHNTLSDELHGTIMDRPYIKFCKCRQCGYETDEKNFGTKCEKCNSEQYDIFDATLNETYIIKGGRNHKGYRYNEYFENAWEMDDWDSYTNYYINSTGSSKEFSVNGVTSFTYSPINNKVIHNPKPSDKDLSKKVKINKTPNICINGDTYDVIDGKYVELCYSSNSIADLKYKKHIKLQIFKDGDLEYAILNGKRKYVETDPNDPSKEKIYFLKDSDCKDEGCSVSKGKYVIFDNCLYLVVDDKISTEEDGATTVYPLLDGYFDINDNRFYISGETVVIQDYVDYNEESFTYTYNFRKITENDLKLFGLNKIEVSNDKSYVTLYYDFVAHDCKVISGYTDSKLDILRRKKVTTDDLGNELPGHFKSIVDISKGEGQSKYNLPYDECTLDILYRTGEVSDLKPIINEKNKFIGNIITDIKFYYTDEFKNIILDESGKQIFVHYANDDNALKAINDCEADYAKYLEDKASNEINDIEDDTSINIPNILFCDITYHLGAVINRENNSYSMDENVHTGVKYVDTVFVTKKVGTYYLAEDKQFTFNYYLLSQDIDTILVSDFNADVIWDDSTYFEMDILIYDKDENNIVTYDRNKFDGFDENNGIIAAQLFRNEFNLGSSLPQNIEADIYIDRGINAAFEKQLKLQEFRTMEALENYGNGWFKINEY